LPDLLARQRRSRPPLAGPERRAAGPRGAARAGRLHAAARMAARERPPIRWQADGDRDRRARQRRPDRGRPLRLVPEREAAGRLRAGLSGPASGGRRVAARRIADRWGEDTVPMGPEFALMETILARDAPTDPLS